MDEPHNSDGEDSYERRMRKKERKKRRKEEKREKKKKHKMEEEEATAESPQKDEPSNLREDARKESPNSSKNDKKSHKKTKKESKSSQENADTLSSDDSATLREAPIPKQAAEAKEGDSKDQSENTASAREAKYIGVNKHKIHGYYETKIIVNKKVHFIGNFASAEEAAHAYDKKALELKGPTAKTNFDKNGNRIEQPHSSKYVGVALHKDRTKFKAYIRGVDGKIVHLGVFEDEKEAARAYDQAARELRGPNAKTNFPPA